MTISFAFPRRTLVTISLSRRRKLQSVFVQISDDLNDALAIAFGEKGWLVAFQPQLNRLFACLNIEFFGDRLDQRDNVIGRHLVFHRAGFHSRHIQKIADHRRKTLGAVVAELDQSFCCSLSEPGISCRSRCMICRMEASGAFRSCETCETKSFFI